MLKRISRIHFPKDTVQKSYYTFSNENSLRLEGKTSACQNLNSISRIRVLQLQYTNRIVFLFISADEKNNNRSRSVSEWRKNGGTPGRV